MELGHHGSAEWSRSSSLTIIEPLCFILSAFASLLVIRGLILLFNTRTAERPAVTVEVLSVPSSTDEPDTPYALMAKYLHDYLRYTFPPGRANAGNITVATELGPTEGSLVTLAQIDEAAERNGGAEHRIGIAQADVVYHYIEGDHPEFPARRQESEVRALAWLFPEWLQVYGEYLGPKGSIDWSKEPMRDASALCIGRYTGQEPLGSGSLVTAINVVRLLGLSLETPEPCSEIAPGRATESADGQESAKSVSGRRWALRMQVIAPERAGDQTAAPGRQSVKKSDEYYIGLPLAGARIVSQAFPKEYSLVDDDELRRRYGQPLNMTTKRGTVSINSLIVVDSGLPEEVASTIHQALFHLESEYCRKDRVDGANGSAEKTGPEGASGEFSRIAKEITERTDFCPASHASKESAATNSADEAVGDRYLDYRLRRTTHLPIRRHPRDRLVDLDVSSRFLVDTAWSERARGVLYTGIGIGGLVITVPVWLRAFMRTQKRSVRRARRRHRKQLAFWCAVLATLHLFVGMGLYVSEAMATDVRQGDDEFIRLGVWNSVWWVTKYLVIEEPYEFVSPVSLALIALMKVGWTATGLVIGYFGTGAIVSMIKGEKHMDHTIVLGWGPIGASVVDELERQRLEWKVVAFRPRVDHKETMDSVAKRYIHAHSISEGLEASGYETARAVVVIGDEQRAHEEGDGDVDLWVSKAVSAVRKKRHGRKYRIVAEVKRSRNREIVRMSGADEIVCIEGYGGEILAHAVSKPGITAVLGEVLRTSRKGSEIYFDSLRADSAGELKTFTRVVKEYEVANKGGERRIPLGIVREEDGCLNIYLNPDENQETLNQGDRIIVLARDAQV
jgi:TrkA family protein